MQRDLFSSVKEPCDWEQIEVPNANIKISRAFLDSASATSYFNELVSTIPWRQDQIRVFGKKHDLPRLQQWYGEPGTVYIWSGVKMTPEPLTPALTRLKSLIELTTGNTFNSLLANLYRNGDDTVGWHSDDEPEFGELPIIASLSLGASRDFVLRHKHRSDISTLKISLTSGSLLVMSGDTQENWQHAVPRRATVKSPRINLTLRTSTALIRKK